MNDSPKGLNQLNRVLLQTLMSKDAANIVADRLEELERENAELKESIELANKLRDAAQERADRRAADQVEYDSLLPKAQEKIAQLERENAALREDKELKNNEAKQAIMTLRQKIWDAKTKHRKSESCERPHTCGACHFYSGGISALSELLGEQGIIWLPENFEPTVSDELERENAARKEQP